MKWHGAEGRRRLATTTAVAVCALATACSGGTSSDTNDAADDETATSNVEMSSNGVETPDATDTTSAGVSTTVPSATEPSDGDAAASDTTSTRADVELTDSWLGVTADTIHLGILAVDFEQLREMGVVDIDLGDPEIVITTFVDEINERGGILGRRIEPHLQSVLPVGTTEAEAACVALTEDVGVFAVLGSFAGPSAEANPCITDTHETIMIGGTPPPEQMERARAPWITEFMAPSRRLAGSIDLYEDAGLIGDRVAVAVDAGEQQLADEIVIPALEEHGHEVVITAVQDVPSDDVPGRDARWDTFIERFRSEDIDTVVAVETESMGAANAIATSDLDVRVLLADSTSYINILSSPQDASPDQLVGVIGTTGPTPDEAWEVPATQECVDLFEAANPDIDVLPSDEVAPGEPLWVNTVVPVCARLRLFEMIATAAGPDLTHETFLAAAESLGEIEVPGQVFASLGRGKLDAADAIRLSEWDPSVDEDGGSTPYGPLTRIP